MHAECGRPFQVNEFSAAASPARGVEHIICPHCGTLHPGNNEYVYLTHPLSSQEESRLKNGACQPDLGKKTDRTVLENRL
jgi:hypothetical protein